MGSSNPTPLSRTSSDDIGGERRAVTTGWAKLGLNDATLASAFWEAHCKQDDLGGGDGSGTGSPSHIELDFAAAMPVCCRPTGPRR